MSKIFGIFFLILIFVPAMLGYVRKSKQAAENAANHSYQYEYDDYEY